MHPAYLIQRENRWYTKERKWRMKAVKIEGKEQIVVTQIGNLLSPMTVTRIGSASHGLATERSTGEHKYRLQRDLTDSTVEFCVEY